MRAIGSLMIALSLVFGIGGVATRSVAEADEGASAACRAAEKRSEAEAKADIHQVEQALSAAAANGTRVIPLNTRGYNYSASGASGDTMPAPSRAPQGSERR